jgi:hypothetical protein
VARALEPHAITRSAVVKQLGLSLRVRALPLANVRRKGALALM